MAKQYSRNLEESHVRETYRYLRIGLIGAAALLGIAVLIERFLVDCWQGSISAYYFTPARAVFVGTLVSVGIVLIVIKGKGIEDLWLNLAGMMAPVVAFVPTTAVGSCFSVDPQPAPLVSGGELADWVVANAENNMWALIIAGALGLILAGALYLRTRESFLWPFQVGSGDRSSVIGMGLVAVIIVGSAIALRFWDNFLLQAHDAAAIAMFIFLAAASVTNAVRSDNPRFKGTYWAVAILMCVTAVVVLGTEALVDDWDHAVLLLEAIEIGLFAVYWMAQTAEHWGETVEAAAS